MSDNREPLNTNYKNDYEDSKLLRLNNNNNNNNSSNDNFRPNDNLIIYNQTSDIIVVNNIESFKTQPIKATCPNCRIKCETDVDKKINKYNLTFCIICVIPWIIVQNIKDKDINCYDASHTCPSCKICIANYSAC